MAITDIATSQLPVVYGLDDNDTFVVNAYGITSLIRYSSIKSSGNWYDIINKPFDIFDNNYFKTKNENNTDVFTLNDDIINQLSLSHKHSNIEVLSLFTVDDNNNLLWDDVKVNEIPQASTDVLGGVKVDGDTITIDENGVISGSSNYELPIASTSVLGGVKPDGSTITVDENGVISGASTYELPKATTTNLGGIMVDGTTITVNADGVITCINEGSVIATWANNVEYPIDCVIVYETTMYKCLETHTSGGTFDSTKWKALTGEKGEAGVSPTAKIEQTELGCTVVVTDASGTTTANLTNGTDGNDGVSPIVNVTPTENGCTVTVTDGTGTTSADLSNGVTPHIDEATKHWFIGDVDTGIVAEGITTISTTSITYMGTLSVDGWVGDTAPYTQDVEISGITSDLSPFIDLIVSDDITTSDEEITQWSYITKATTGDDIITFRCNKTKPTIELNFKVKVV